MGFVQKWKAGVLAASEGSKHKGIVQQLVTVVFAVIMVGVLLAVGGIVLGRMDYINQNNLGNNTNATILTNSSFDILKSVPALIGLVVFLVLIGLALGYLFGAFGGMGGASGGRGKRQ